MFCDRLFITKFLPSFTLMLIFRARGYFGIENITDHRGQLGPSLVLNLIRSFSILELRKPNEYLEP